MSARQQRDDGWNGDLAATAFSRRAWKNLAKREEKRADGLETELAEAYREILTLATPTTATHEHASTWLYQHDGTRCACGYCGTGPSPVKWGAR